MLSLRTNFHSLPRPSTIASSLCGAIALALVLAVLPAEAGTCDWSEDCADDEVCITKLEVPGALPHLTAWADVTKKFPHKTCVSRDDLQQHSCRISQGCDWFGRCTAVDGECRAVHEEDCRASQECAVHASCTVRDGECAVGSDADCAKTTRCSNLGLCSAGEEKCIAARDTDCHQSEVCKQGGNCKAEGGNCIPG
jgi:hypothetical protein